MPLVKFGDLQDGDIIRGANGEPLMVKKTYNTHIPETMYEIEADNGNIIKASGNHLWYIETSNDYSMHRQRRISGKKIVSKLNSDALQLLVETAESEDEIETSVADMIELVGSRKDPEVVQMIVRIAESLGHIAENNSEMSDLHTGEKITTENRTYDAKLFSQQILSMFGRKMKKRWPLIIGRVVTTEQLVTLYEDAELPVMKMR